MLNHLAKIKGLYVAGRTSTFSFKGKDEDLRVIGGKLNVAHILEGSIRKAGNRIRITAQLIKAADGYHLWSESYDRELDDVFAIQEDIANAVTDALSITLGVGNFGVGSTRNIVAYDAYLAALSLINQGGREDAIQAIERLEQAVSLDPDFADAWSTLAAISYSTAQIYIPERAEEFLKKLEHATSRTIAIAPDTFVSYRATALLEYSGRNWSKAEQAYKKALELTPTDFWINALFGFFLQSVGRPQEAVEHCRRAVKCEPLTVNPAQILGVGYELNGELYSALVEYARGRELLGNQALLNGPRIAAALTKGDRAPIEAAFKEYMASSSDMLLSGHQDLNQTMFDHLDEPEEAISALHRFYQDPAYNNPFISSVIALWASYYGEHELALDIFQKFHASRSFLTYLIWRPIHKPIRQLPGFKDLVRNLGLVDYWRETGNWGQFCRPVGEDDFECI
jgi:Tfp pilus assembly protein PilF